VGKLFAALAPLPPGLSAKTNTAREERRQHPQTRPTSCQPAISVQPPEVPAGKTSAEEFRTAANRWKGLGLGGGENGFPWKPLESGTGGGGALRAHAAAVWVLVCDARLCRSPHLTRSVGANRMYTVNNRLLLQTVSIEFWPTALEQCVFLLISFKKRSFLFTHLSYNCIRFLTRLRLASFRVLNNLLL